MQTSRLEERRGESIGVSVLAENNKVIVDVAPPCCDGNGKCDGESLVRLGASLTTGDLSLLSLSIPAYQWKRPPLDETETKSIRVWFVVVASQGEGHDRPGPARPGHP